tara:strand:+ start:252 stop:443 length:192 start_codon:yes stop_codon:yes gene_type:complete
MKELKKLEKQILSDGILLFLEQIQKKERLSNKDKQRFNSALNVAKKFSLDILDWEEQRYEIHK